MLYAHLALILRFLKKNLPCPGCSKHFTNHEIDILEIHDDACVLFIACESCDLELEVEILTKEGELEPHINILSESPVTEEDVENISKVLSNHKGSLKSLLKDNTN